MSRDTLQRRIRRSETDTLRLERLLQTKPKESIERLHTILVTESKEEPIELSDFFQLRDIITSVQKNDTIIIELVQKILAEKEEDTSSLSQEVTPAQNNNISGHYQDDDSKQDANTTESTQQDQPSADDQKDFDPVEDISDLDSMITEQNVGDVSNHSSPSQGHQSYPANKKDGLNKDAPEWFDEIGKCIYIQNNNKNIPLDTITEGNDEDPDIEMNFPQTSSTPSTPSISSSPLTQASSKTDSPPVNNMNHRDAPAIYKRTAEAMTSSLTEFSGSSVPVQSSPLIINNSINPMGTTMGQSLITTTTNTGIIAQPIFPIPSLMSLPTLIAPSVTSVSNNSLSSANMVRSQPNYIPILIQPQLSSVLRPNVLAATSVPLPSQPLAPTANYASMPYQPQFQSIPNALNASSVPLGAFQFQPSKPTPTPTPTPRNTPTLNPFQFQSTPNVISNVSVPTYIPPPNQSQFQSTPNVASVSSYPSTTTPGYTPPLQMCPPQPQYEPQFQNISAPQHCADSVSTGNTINYITSVQPMAAEQLSTINNNPTEQMQSMNTFVNPVNLNDNDNNTCFKPTPMEHKNIDADEDENLCRTNIQWIQASIGSTPPIPRQWTAAQSLKFKAKFNNHAKGNFYISKDMIKKMAKDADEEFNTDDINDERLAFGYFKESVAMSINDKQIDNIFRAPNGELVIVINIDLTFRDSQTNMYLIAIENDAEFVEKVRWRIVDFMSATQIYNNLGISNDYLPQSSRNMPWFIDGMSKIPKKLSRYDIQRILRDTHFKSLPAKESKRNCQYIPKSQITEQDLAFYVKQSFSNDKYPIIPVVVIKGKNQWIEWKRIVCIFREFDIRPIYIAISLRFHESNKQWKIECLDYDAGRVYYQHRLALLPSDHKYSYSFQEISNYITTTLNISHRYSNYILR